MNRHSYENQLLFALKKVMGTQRAAAQAVGCTEDMYFYYMNHARKVPTDLLIQIKVLLLNHREKVHALSDKDLSINEVEATFLLISMQATLAKTLMKQPIKRPGRPSAQVNEKKSKACKNFYTFKERRAKRIAKQCGFRNHTTMYQAFNVISKGCPELIAAMDKGVVKISVAAKLASLSKALQQQLVGQGIDVIKAYFKAQQSKQPLKKMTPFDGVKRIETDKRLEALEITYQLPLRKTLIGLLGKCDGVGAFILDIAQLKTGLLLKEIPVETLEASLGALCQEQIIKKKASGKKFIGHILF